MASKCLQIWPNSVIQSENTYKSQILPVSIRFWSNRRGGKKKKKKKFEKEKKNYYEFSMVSVQANHELVFVFLVLFFSLFYASQLTNTQYFSRTCIICSFHSVYNHQFTIVQFQKSVQNTLNRSECEEIKNILNITYALLSKSKISFNWKFVYKTIARREQLEGWKDKASGRFRPVISKIKSLHWNRQPIKIKCL